MGSFQVDLSGKVALVTGAGRGIGRAIALGLAHSGAAVCANDINPDRARSTADAIIAAGGDAMPWVADVSNKFQVGSMVEALRDRWQRFDILINNANVNPESSIIKLDEWDWRRVLDVNLTGAFFCSQMAGRVMMDEGGGVIVNMVSSGAHNSALEERAAYIASKAGLVGFTSECAREYAAYSVRVNAIAPSVMETEATAAMRQDVVGVLLFLCSDAASYITGQTIHVDGGKAMM